MTSSKKMLVVCPYPERVAPSQRLKYEQYFDYFRSCGWTIQVEPFMSVAFWGIVYKKGNILAKVYHTLLGYCKRLSLLFSLHRYEVVYVHLWVVPFGPPIYEFLYKLFHKHIIYDIDDMVFLKPKSMTNAFIDGLKGSERMHYLMKHSIHNIVCTPMLAAYVGKFSEAVTDISSTINTSLYVPNNLYSNESKLTLGWSGSHSTSKYLHLLDKVLLALAEKRTFKLLIIGDPYFTIPGLEIEAIAWSEKDEVRNLQHIDIGLYPLPTNDPWVNGKSGLKALQYMALGIPTVATAIGANYRIIEHNKNGFLVNSDLEWINTLTMLIDRPDVRREVGLEAVKQVENKYSVEANKHTYLHILENAINYGSKYTIRSTSAS